MDPFIGKKTDDKKTNNENKDSAKTKELTEKDRPRLIKYVTENEEKFKEIINNFVNEQPLDKIPIKKLEALCKIIKNKGVTE